MNAIKFIFTSSLLLGLSWNSSAANMLDSGQMTSEEASHVTEVISAKDLACEKDWKCRMDRHAFVAAVSCHSFVEGVATYGMRWSDPDTASDITWADFDHGILLIEGDHALLKNKDGLYESYRYRCEYDVKSGRLVNNYVRPVKAARVVDI